MLKPGAEIINQLQQLKQLKQIKKVGVSVYDHLQLKFVNDNFDIDLVQLPLSIFDRRMIENGMLRKLKNKVSMVAQFFFKGCYLCLHKIDQKNLKVDWLMEHLA